MEMEIEESHFGSTYFFNVCNKMSGAAWVHAQYLRLMGVPLVPYFYGNHFKSDFTRFVTDLAVILLCNVVTIG